MVGIHGPNNPHNSVDLHFGVDVDIVDQIGINRRLRLLGLWSEQCRPA
jgi:hypothetical protein